MSDSPARRRRRLIERRVALFGSRLSARCFAYDADVAAGELGIVHPDRQRFGARRVVAVVDLVSLTVDVLDDTYRPGVACVVALARRAENLDPSPERATDDS